jgi:hypothetical protein
LDQNESKLYMKMDGPNIRKDLLLNTKIIFFSNIVLQ